MNHRLIIWLIGIVSLLSLAVWSLSAAEPTPSPDLPAAEGAQPGSRSKTDDLEETLRKLDLQSAELSLQLYELDMQKIDDMNKKMANLYSTAEVDRFRASVEMARQRVKAARARAEGKRVTAIVGVGQSLLQNAEDTLQRDMAANRQLATAVKPVDVERDRVAVAMAKVNLDKAKLVEQLDSPAAVLNWEIDVLRDEVRQLRWRITAITSRR